MTIKVGCSQKRGVEEAVAELGSQILFEGAKGVLYFASPSFAPAQLAAQMQQKFSGCQVCGCSTAGELLSGKMLKDSLVAMALGPDVVEDMAVELVLDLTRKSEIQKAFERFSVHFGCDALELDVHQYVGIILVDGLSGLEERVMECIGDLTNVTFVGGSAGDNLAFQKTHVYAGEKAVSGAAVLCLMRLRSGFDLLKTQSFRPTPKILVANRVDEARRMVFEFNGQPAARAYADAVGARSLADCPQHFMRSPLGLMVKGEPFVRSPQRLEGEAMVFYCHIKEGMGLTLLESTDIVQDTERALSRRLGELGPVHGVINFHCILRTLELENKHQTEAYGRIFQQVPTVGFSTYGEQYIGHINQTSTLLIFKK